MNFQARFTLGLLLAAATVLSTAAEASRAAEPVPPGSTGTNAAAEFKLLEAADDMAQGEVDKWIRENNELKQRDAGFSKVEMDRRIAKRFEPVRLGYEEFLRRHAEDAHARLVYGSFLNDRQDERGAQVQWEKALELDPTNPAVYNALAGRYSESGPVDKVFVYFGKAIELGPAEPAYYYNFANSLYVLRKSAALYYGISEQGVYGKAVMLYSNAFRLDPTNFAFARDLAQTYYSIKPLPSEAALGAWTNALTIAREEEEREDVCVHLARVKMLAGRLAEARMQLQSVTNQAFLQAKSTLLHNIEEREKQKP